VSNNRSENIQRPIPDRGGFTLMELLVAIVFIGIMTAIMAPKIVPVLTRSSAGQAISVVANDLELAVSLASRQRRPVRISCDCAAGTYTLTDRESGAVLFRRVLGGPNAGFGITGLTLSETTDVFPSGVASAVLTVTVSASGVSRQATMSTGGFVRIIR
jgi:prepilin-type N-terminal cleavage/methylation domain-containing protein